MHLRLLAGGMLLLALVQATQGEPPPIPVGLDAYRQWDRWPYQRIGARAYMRSTYDRDGGNRTADASHFLYQERDDFNVSLDVEGAGVLYFVRTNHWHGSPWHYEIDGVDHLVQETSTADPTKPVSGSVFIPEHLFPNPLTWTWSITKGADLNWVPMPFERSLRLAYSWTFYGTGYYIYHHYMPGAKLSQPLRAWDGTSAPDRAVLELIGRAGTDIAPQDIANVNGSFEPGGGALRIEGPKMLRALKLTIPRDRALDFDHARLRITWDDRANASVDAPLPLFFGAGTFYNRDDREFLVRGFPLNIRFVDDRVELGCYWPMPFFRSARIELLDIPAGVHYEIRHEPFTDPPNHVGYFHATYADHPGPHKGHDMVLLDTTTVEGGGDWSGTFVGTSFIFSHNAVLSTLEGDPRFFFDDSRTPQAQGTGTEEWGGGGDYWGGLNMTLPFAGHPSGARSAKEAKHEKDLVQSAYRFLLADLMPFGKNARICLEPGAEGQSGEHYQTVTYWYGLPAPSLVKTDELNIGDEASEREHRYHSPDASPPQELTSRYELGVDTMLVGAAHPLADPASYAEWEFEADAGVTYHIWLRGRALRVDHQSDAVWLQFDNEIGTDRLADSYASPFGAGNWLDSSSELTHRWSSGRPQDRPLTVTFDRSGRHRLRVQVRHGPHHLQQIWLSPSQKHLPAQEQPHDGIVLNATAARIAGQHIRLVGDEDATKVLRIDGSRAVVYPAHTEIGRHTTGTSQFTLKLRPDNLGVMLRRTLDYSFPNQRAEVFIADASHGESDNLEWQRAGVWYLAGSNTFYHSYPKHELGEPNPVVYTSNRRFRDDEFLVPRHLTQGRRAIRVRITFTPVKRPLLPGMEIPPLAWSELRYHAYCFVAPAFQQ